jgi:hypothetical protein
MRNAHKISVGKSDWKRPFGRPRRRREDYNKKDFKEMGCENVEWLQLAQDRVQWQDLAKSEELIIVRGVTLSTLRRAGRIAATKVNTHTHTQVKLLEGDRLDG